MADKIPTSKPAPNLASILQALAGFSKQQQDQIIPQPAPSTQPQQQNNEAFRSSSLTPIPQQPYPVPVIPQQFPPQIQYPPQQQYPQHQYATHPGPGQQQNYGIIQQYPDRNQALNSNAMSNRKVVDPATIIDWPAGLRCVMRTVGKHDQMIHEIRRMIKSQREHEEQWFASRTALLEKQKSRKENREKLAAVLRSVGSTTAENSTSDVDIAALEISELKTYDEKVYKAQWNMVKEMSARLKEMGIPFFGTRSELVRKGKGEGGGVGLDGVVDGKIGEEELMGLQRRMLGILEDMCEEG